MSRIKSWFQTHFADATDGHQRDEHARPRYRPLNRDLHEIRLLKILPARDPRSDVRAKLRTVRLAGPKWPVYETISYVWGDPKDTGSVFIDGCRVKVPASSLRVLRKVRVPRRPRTVWIDAICINQSNLDERAQQVSCMGEIYRHSQGNLIDLGEVSEDTVRDFSHSMEAILAEMNQDTCGLTDGVWIDANRGAIKYAESGLRCQVNFEALQHIYSLSWFSRLWVFQEAALAPKSTCYLGSSPPLDLLEIVRTARWLQYKYDFIRYNVGDTIGMNTCMALYNFVDDTLGFYRQLNDSGNERTPTFATLYQICYAMQCSDARDRVYGMAGLADLSDDVHSYLAVNYSKPVHHVLRDATRYAIQDRGLSMMLADVDAGDGYTKGHPSWVPPWDRPRQNRTNPLRLWLGFNASLGRKQLWPSTAPNDLNVLQVTGFVVDRISDRVGTILRPNTDRMYTAKDVSKWWLETLALFESPSDQTTPASVLMGGMNSQQVSASQEDLLAIHDFQHFLVDQGRFPKDLKDSKDLTGPEARASRFWNSVDRACQNRKPFRTSNDRMGIGPSRTEVGDIVVILYDCGPFILRPVGDDYNILGACYIHGIMFGEATQAHIDSGAPDTVFRLV